MEFDLNYQVQGHGMPLFFQHGLGGNLFQSQELLASIPDIRLFTMDCPGHGSTPLIKNQPPTFQNYANHLLALMNHEKVEKAVVGGISMGSGIALNLALRHPERFSGLIILRPAWLDNALPENLQILLSVCKYANQDDGIAKFKRDPLYRKIRKQSEGAAESILSQFINHKGAHVEIILKSMIEDRPISSLAALQTCKVPTLILANHEDPLHPYQMAATLHKRLPNAEFQTVAPRYEDHEKHQVEVRNAVSRFLEKIN